MAFPGESGRYRVPTDFAAAPLHTDAEASDNPMAGEGAASVTQSPRPIAGFAPQPKQTDHLPGWELAGIAAGLVALGVAAGLLGLAGV